MTNEITLQNTANGVTATFSGPKSQEIVALFGTNVIPCPFSQLRDNSAAYIEYMQQNWPGYSISFTGASNA